MIYLTGDTHCDNDIQKLASRNFPEQKRLTRNDYLIVLGDFGLYWFGPKHAITRYWRDWYLNKKFTILWIDGNHENYDVIKMMPITQWHGGKVQADENIIHLMRGQVYDLDGLTIFTMGGARSVDKDQRVPGRSWWPQEEPAPAELEEGRKNLEKHGDKADLILTHTGPGAVVERMFGYGQDPCLGNYFDSLAANIEFRAWCFGHHHEEKDDGKYHCFYNRIMPADVLFARG